VPFDKERIVSATYSLKSLKDEVLNLGVQLSDYKGGASIGSYLCKRAGEAEIEYVSFYAFVPTYDFSRLGEGGGAIRIENDFTAWIGIMRRINHMLDLNLNLSDLEGRSQQLVQAMQEKVEELDRKNPELGIREYLSQLTDNFEVTPFEPLDEFWEEQLRDLFDKLDPDEPAEDPGEP
jgi:hypothetical protein